MSFFGLAGEVADGDRALRRMASMLAHRGPVVATVTTGVLRVGLLVRHPELAHTVGRAEIDGTIAVASGRLDGECDRPIADRILEAWITTGVTGLARLRGDFAAMLYASDGDHLTLIRDHFGIRPLYFAADPDRVVFGPEPDAVDAGRSAAAGLDEIMLLDGLDRAAPDLSRTYFRGVERLLPGHVLEVKALRPASPQPYYELQTAGPERPGTAAAHADELRLRLAEAVQRRLSQREHVGFHLSGGLDSGTIVALAAQEATSQDAPLRTYSGVFERVLNVDERHYVEALTSRGGIESLLIAVDDLGLLQRLGDFTTVLGEPATAGNLGISIAMHRAAAADGVIAMLDGFDGDTTISHGARRMYELARAWRLHHLYRQASGVAATYGGSGGRMAWSYAAAYTPGIAKGAKLGRRIVRRLHPGSGGRPTPPDLVLPEFRHHVDAQRTTPRPTPSLRHERFGSERQEHVTRLQQWYMPHTLDLLDATAARFGIEARYPFWDRDLIEFCVSLPASSKLDEGWTRYVMRLAMQDVLPPPLQWRRDKSNLAPATVRAFAELDVEFVHEAFRPDGALAEYVDVRRAIERYGELRTMHAAAEPGLPAQQHTVELFTLAATGLWLDSRRG